MVGAAGVPAILEAIMEQNTGLDYREKAENIIRETRAIMRLGISP
jgi:hypothetical protein